jgi:hypothetical protein
LYERTIACHATGSPARGSSIPSPSDGTSHVKATPWASITRRRAARSRYSGWIRCTSPRISLRDRPWWFWARKYSTIEPGRPTGSYVGFGIIVKSWLFRSSVRRPSRSIQRKARRCCASRWRVTASSAS